MGPYSSASNSPSNSIAFLIIYQRPHVITSKNIQVTRTPTIIINMKVTLLSFNVLTAEPIETKKRYRFS